MKKVRSLELAIRTVVVSTAAAARMHMRQGNSRLAGESVARGIAMLEDMRARLPEEGDGVGELYRDGRHRLQELADEAEADCSSTRG